VKKAFLCAAAFLLFFFGKVYGEVTFSAAKWNFGTITASDTVNKELTVYNNQDAPLSVSIVETCACLKVEPEKKVIKSGGEGAFTLTFIGEGYEGGIEKYYIIRTDSSGLKKAMFPVTGFVKTSGTAEEAAEKTSDPMEAAKDKTSGAAHTVVDASYYYTPGCRECRKFLTETVPAVGKKLETEIQIKKGDILDSDTYQKLITVLKGLKTDLKKMPVLIIGDTVLQGSKKIEKGFAEAVKKEASGGAASQSKDEKRESTGSSENGNEKSPAANSVMRQLGIVSVLAAGLLDGVNPCAFTTIIFLLSALVVAGRQRKEVFVIGVFFTLSVFITYFSLGLGFFSALRKADTYPLIASIIQWILFGIMLVFSLLSFYDYSLIKRGRLKDIKMQLPGVLKKQIHTSIRTRVKSAALIGSALVLGFLVSIFELACTGQVYFPTIAYMVQVRQSASGFLLLTLYNIGFIVPLIVVFILAYFGVGSDRFITFFQKQAGKVKLATAVLFLVLAGVMLYLIAG